MKVQDVIATVDEFAPPGLSYSWDRDGLATGRVTAEVSKVLVALTITREAFAIARKEKAEMIVAHHPLIWDALKSLRDDDPETSLILDVARAGIACYSAHTSLDVVPGGVNHVLANKLELINLKPLFPVSHARQVKLVTFVPESHLEAVRDAVSEAGAGIIGNYTHCSFSVLGEGTYIPGDQSEPFAGKKGKLNTEAERRFETIVPKVRLHKVLDALFQAHPYDEIAYDLVALENVDESAAMGLRGELAEAQSLQSFAAAVRNQLEIETVRVVGDTRGMVRTVAVLGGAGGSQIAKIPPGVDAFVTGDVKYHDAWTAHAKGLAVIDAGHHGTEKWIVPTLARHLEEHLDNLAVITYMEPDVFKTVGQ